MVRAANYDISPAIRRKSPDANSAVAYDVSSARNKEVFYLVELGRDRHLVENFFGRIKRHRRVSTRYDKLPETFLAFVSLAALADWVRF
jgi:transposase